MTETRIEELYHCCLGITIIAIIILFILEAMLKKRFFVANLNNNYFSPLVNFIRGHTINNYFTKVRVLHAYYEKIINSGKIETNPNLKKYEC